MTLIIGVDPGKYGALALWQPGATTAVIADMPITDGEVDPTELGQIIRAFQRTALSLNQDILAVVEKVHSRPRQAGVFGFGMSTGIVHGVLGCSGIKIDTLPPNLWKPRMGLRRNPDEADATYKTRSRELASRLLPDVAGDFKRMKDDGRAEACLIAIAYASLKGIR